MVHGFSMRVLGLIIGKQGSDFLDQGDRAAQDWEFWVCGGRRICSSHPCCKGTRRGRDIEGGHAAKKDLLEWLFRSRMCAAAKARRNCQPFTGQLKLCRSMTSFPEPSHSEVFRSLRSQAYLQSGSASTCGAPAIPLAGGLGRGRLRRRCGRCADWAWAARGMRREVRSGTRTLW